MTEEDKHDALHHAAEDAVRDIINTTFPDDPTCRADVLINVLREEIDAMDNREDVIEVAETMAAIIFKRTVGDALLLFDTQGNA